MLQGSTEISLPELYRKNFDLNLKILKEKDRALFLRVLETNPLEYLETTQDGYLTLKIGSIYLESRYRPSENSRLYTGNLLHENFSSEKIISIGCGLGYHLNEILNKKPSSLLLIEKDLRVFTAALYIIDPGIFHHIIPLIDCTIADVVSILESFLKSRVIVHPHSFRLNRAYYLQITNFLKNLMQAETASSVTESICRKLWVKNIFKNIKNLQGKFHATGWLSGYFKGPALLIASGPFMEDGVQMLNNLESRVPIFTLLPSVPYLLQKGITPDFVLTTDAGFGNRLRLLRGVKLPLFTTLSTDPVLLRNWEGKIFVFSHNLPLEKRLSGIRQLSLEVPMQGTSSAVMILLARKLGFSPLYLAGYDFAFRGMKDHHRGAGFDSYFIFMSNRLRNWYTMLFQGLRRDFILKVETAKGEKTLSTYKLLLYRNWIRDNLLGPNIFRINDGAVIDGINYLNLNDISCKGEKQVCDTFFEKASKHIISQDKVAGDLLQLQKQIEEEGSEFIKNSSKSEHKLDLLKDCSYQMIINKIHTIFFGEKPGTCRLEEMREEVIGAIRMLERAWRGVLSDK